MTRTVSPFATCSLCRFGSRPRTTRDFLYTSGFISNHLGRQRHDLHELFLTQLAAHRAEDARSAGLALVVDQHGGVFVETDVGAVLALGLLGRPHDDRLHHLALLHLAGGVGVLDRDHDDVAQPRVAALGPAEHADHERAARTRVVRDLDLRFLLHHGYFAFSMISTTRQRFRFDKGRVSTMRTVSPVLAPDRKSTRLNSSHLVISYAVFCLKKKKEKDISVCDLHNTDCIDA